MTQRETLSRKIRFDARASWFVLTGMMLVLTAAGCADKVGLGGRTCPCASGYVCCPSGVCVAEGATCDGGPSSAPVALAFTRRSEATGDFSWDPVSGATSYILYVNGTAATTTAATSATLEIGAGNVDVRVAAVNDGGSSAKSGSFPVLFDVSLRACGSDTVEARWHTAADTDTQLSIEQTGQNTIACTDPTLRQDHLYGDIASCTQLRLPSGLGGRLTPGSAMTVNMMSRDQLGFLGKYQSPLTVPGQSCMCATSSKGVLGGGCNPTPPDGPMGQFAPTLPPCGPAFDLEAGKLVNDPSQGDVSMEASEDADGSITELRLVAPGGVAVLADKAMCDVVDAPTTGYVQKVTLETGVPGGASAVYPERTTTFVIKTRNGRYAKLSLECNCPGAVGASGTGVGALGMRFGWRVTAAGSTTFND
ncbi:MAG TPA: hypothetical protein VIF57_02460 [Polyangia bacterium]